MYKKEHLLVCGLTVALMVATATAKKFQRYKQAASAGFAVSHVMGNFYNLFGGTDKHWSKMSYEQQNKVIHLLMESVQELEDYVNRIQDKSEENERAYHIYVPIICIFIAGLGLVVFWNLKSFRTALGKFQIPLKIARQNFDEIVKIRNLPLFGQPHNDLPNHIPPHHNLYPYAQPPAAAAPPMQPQMPI